MWPVKRQEEESSMSQEVKASKPSSSARAWMSSTTALRLSKFLISSIVWPACSMRSGFTMMP